MIRPFSYLTPKNTLAIEIDVDGNKIAFQDAEELVFDPATVKQPPPPQAPDGSDAGTAVPLIRLAWALSGDKGNKANIGMIAPDPAHLPYIWAALTTDSVAERFGHFIEGGVNAARIDKYYLPGSHAINFLIEAVLVASIRNDAQGKGYGQILLAHPVVIPAALADRLDVGKGQSR